jgi:hypothetical protein
VSNPWDTYVTQCAELDLSSARLAERMRALEQEKNRKIEVYQDEATERIENGRSFIAWADQARDLTNKQIIHLGLAPISERPEPDVPVESSAFRSRSEIANVCLSDYERELASELRHREAVLEAERSRRARTIAFLKHLPYRLLIILRLIFVPVYIWWLFFVVLPTYDPDITVDTFVFGLFVAWIVIGTFIGAQALSGARWGIMGLAVIGDLFFVLIGAFFVLGVRVISDDMICEPGNFNDCWLTPEDRETGELAGNVGLFLILYAVITLTILIRFSRSKKSQKTSIARETLGWTALAIAISLVFSLPLTRAFFDESSNAAQVNARGIDLLIETGAPDVQRGWVLDSRLGMFETYSS